MPSCSAASKWACASLRPLQADRHLGQPRLHPQHQPGVGVAGRGQLLVQGLVGGLQVAGAGLHVGGAALRLQRMGQRHQPRAFGQRLRIARLHHVDGGAPGDRFGRLRVRARRPSPGFAGRRRSRGCIAGCSPCNNQYWALFEAVRRQRLEGGRCIAHVARVALGHGQVEVAPRDFQPQGGVVGAGGQLLAQRVDPAHGRVGGAAGQALDDFVVAGGSEGRGGGEGAGQRQRGGGCGAPCGRRSRHRGRKAGSVTWCRRCGRRHRRAPAGCSRAR